jgi:F-type H+-transporting ATPase subunit a
MAAGSELTPSEYIQHHLTFFTKPIGDGGFWSLNLDSIIVSIVLGVLGVAFLWLMVRNATTGVPGKLQAFVEVVLDFVDGQAKSIFHDGDRHRFIAPLAVTVFVWVVLMNAMDFLPADVVGLATHHVSAHGFHYVPTADVNTTFALSISVLLLSIFFAISIKGLGGWLHELFFAPFGSHPLLIPANFLFQMVEYISKTLSHSLRLFGNMYAGEILFLLLWMWAANSTLRGDFGIFWILSVLLGVGWGLFHILIVLLQAYIFMMLTVVYISMAHEHH